MLYCVVYMPNQAAKSKNKFGYFFLLCVLKRLEKFNPIFVYYNVCS